MRRLLRQGGCCTHQYCQEKYVSVHVVFQPLPGEASSWLRTFEFTTRILNKMPSASSRARSFSSSTGESRDGPCAISSITRSSSSRIPVTDALPVVAAVWPYG